MTNPDTIVSGVLQISPAAESFSLLLSGRERPWISVQFLDGQEARIDPSDERSAAYLATLQDLHHHNRPAYVEIDLQTRTIRRVSAPLIVTVRDVIALDDGNYRVRLETSAAVHTLQRDSPYFDEFLELLQNARKNRGWVLATVCGEIIDVRDAPDPQPPGTTTQATRSPADYEVCSRATVTPAEAQRLFNLIFAKHHCDPTTITDPCIPFNYPYNFCWARAHAMYRILQDQQVQVCKIWAFGDTITVATSNEPSCYAKWEFHVALTLNVSGVNGTTAKVLDPALFPDGPVLTADWKTALHGASTFRETDPILYTLSQDCVRGYDDDEFSSTESDLSAARGCLRERVQKNGPPPYMNCVSEEKGEITLLLLQLRKGDRQAESLLAEKVYNQLRRIAKRQMRGEAAGHTLQPTVLVHEAYLQIVGQDKEFQNRAHFFAIAAQLMGRILVDHARSAKAQKRGGGAYRVDFDERWPAPGVEPDHVLALDEALSRLRAMDVRQSRIVEMKIFAGLEEEEIAEVLDVSSRTVKRDWKVAKAWLQGELSK